MRDRAWALRSFRRVVAAPSASRPSVSDGPRFVSGRVGVSVGGAAPLAERGEEGGRINRLALCCRVHDVHGDAQLLQVRLTAAAAGDMGGEALALLAREACLEVLGRELDYVSAREPTASHGGHVPAAAVARVGFMRGVLVAGVNAASHGGSSVMVHA